jgi:hypothetical protein
MKLTKALVTLSLGIFSPIALGAAVDQPPTADPHAPKIITFRAAGDNQVADVILQLADADPAVVSGDAQIVFTADDAAGGSGGNGVWVTSDDEDAAPQVVKIKKMMATAPAGGPWIGVQFSPVPKPLAAQLRIKAETGQMIGNVMEGSPADVAGFQQYDVVTTIDGADVSNKIDEFLDKVRTFKPGESHTFALLRAGQTVTSNVVIGERPSEENMPKAKFPSDFEELAGGQVFGRSGLLQKDPSGHWNFQGFNMKDLPDVWKSIPDVDDMDFNIAVPGPGSNQVYVSKVDGKTIRIQKDDSGKITVTKTENKNGDKSTRTTTYNSEGEVQAADPDAYKMLQDGPAFQFFGNVDKLPGCIPQIKIEAAMKNSEEAMKRLEERMQQLHQNPGAAQKGMFLKRMHTGTSFETQSNGSIKVITRDGGDELVQTYDNADALKTARPELYEKYQKLQDQDGTK